jgi:hypothetical protein
MTYIIQFCETNMCLACKITLECFRYQKEHGRTASLLHDMVILKGSTDFEIQLGH